MQEPCYFEPNAARLELGLASGKRVIFYKGKPKRNPITDPRDLKQLRANAEVVEVVEVQRHKDLPPTWVPAQAYRETRRVVTSHDVRGQPATPTPLVPANPVTMKKPVPDDLPPAHDVDADDAMVLEDHQNEHPGEAQEAPAHPNGAARPVGGSAFPPQRKRRH